MTLCKEHILKIIQDRTNYNSNKLPTTRESCYYPVEEIFSLTLFFSKLCAKQSPLLMEICHATVCKIRAVFYRYFVNG